jgi:hypothetical protein
MSLMNKTRAVGSLFWVLALAIGIRFVLDTLIGGWRVGGGEGLFWAVVLLVGLLVGTIVMMRKPKV